jgi:hypothetical protein
MERKKAIWYGPENGEEEACDKGYNEVSWWGQKGHQRGKGQLYLGKLREGFLEEESG